MLGSIYKNYKYRFEGYDYIFTIENFEKFQIRVKHALHTYKTKGEFKNSVI